MSKEYNPETCITAKELRAKGIPVPESIPDCGWIPRWAAIPTDVKTSFDVDDQRLDATFTFRFAVPFKWIDIEFTIEKQEG